ncbi:MAG TPA: RHS repeat-associated core domain-containing protein, partial [Verrucomicrobiae bacterium]
GRGAAALARPGGGSSPWQLASETRYIYDGMRVIQERDANNVPVVSYTRGTDLGGSLEGAGGIGGLLARSHGYSGGSWTTHNDYHADGNGNVTYLVDSSQGLAASYRYDAYGNTLAASGSLATANGYRFSSKEIHVLTGLYYYGYRWYAPDLQRWVNQDPIGELGGINLYAMVANNPVSRYDANGLAECSDPCGDAKKKGLDKGHPAGTVCCGGKKFPCVWDPNGDTNPRDSMAKKIIGSCMEAHEKEHVNDPGVTCESKCLSMAKSNHEAECNAYTAELACLRSAIRACAGNPQCINQVKDAMGTTKMGIKEHCRK